MLYKSYNALTYDWIGMGGGKIVDTEVFENILKRFNSELGVNLTGKKLSKFLDFNQSEITGSEITGSEITEDGLKKVETEPGVKQTSNFNSSDKVVEQAQIQALDDVNNEYINLSILIEYMKLKELRKIGKTISVI